MKRKPAIIVDIDWTVANKWDRSPYDWTKVIEDIPYNDIIHLVQILSKEYSVLFVSWRDFSCAIDTCKWLDTFYWEWYRLFMRLDWDKRSDDIVKKEILDVIIEDYEVHYVLDDRNRVVSMWRAQWLRCLQVQEWNF